MLGKSSPIWGVQCFQSIMGVFTRVHPFLAEFFVLQVRTISRLFCHLSRPKHPLTRFIPSLFYHFISLLPFLLRKKSVREREMKAGLLGLMTGSEKPSDQMNDKVGRAAMARVLNLRDIFELINDRLNNRAFAH